MSTKKMTIFNGERNERYDYLITKEQPLSYTTESFQKTIINLDYANIDQKIKVIQFTSTLASEGKSTFVSNLAYLLSQKNKKVILLDLDLRKSKMHRVFNIPNKDGLTDYLAGKITYENLIQHSNLYDFDYIISGEKTTSIVNILESSKLKDLINKLREAYDYILLDTPPVIAVSDALYVARNVDGIIFIVSQGIAKKSLVKEAIKTLRSSNMRIIGTVLTQVSLKSRDYGYGYDYSYKYED